MSVSTPLRDRPPVRLMPPTLVAAEATRVRPSLFAAPGLRAALLLLAPLLLFTFARFFSVPTDPDYWWHVRTGQYIVETRSVPRVDLYSYTVAGHPWVSQEWLTEVLMHLVAVRFGYVGNAVLFGFVGVATALAVYLMCRWRGVGETSATLLMLWAAVMALPLVNVRPQMVTALLLGVLALLLTRYKQGHARALWPLPALMLLWVNLHAGYVIGLGLLGLTIVGEAFARVRRREAAPLPPLLGVTALSAAATLITPHGLNALAYPLTYLKGNASLQYVAEWQSPDFHQAMFLIFAASLLVALVLGLGRRPLGPTETLWAVCFALLGLQSARHIPLYAVVVTPLIGARLQAELPSYRRSLAAWPRAQVAGAAAVNWLLPVVTIAGTMMMAQLDQGPVVQLGFDPSPETFPAGGVEYLRAHDLQGNLFNEYHWGGYVIERLYPRQRVFIDGRADPYGDDLIQRYRLASHAGPGWRQTLRDYDIRLVLIDKNSPLAVALHDDAGWEEVYTGKVERLFVRRSS